MCVLWGKPMCRPIALALLVAVSGGCATISATSPAAVVRLSAAEEWVSWPQPEPRSFVGHLVAQRAGALVGVPLRTSAPDLPDDCTGLVRAAWRVVDLPLLADAERGDSGVQALWRFAERRQAVLSPCDLGVQAGCVAREGAVLEPGDILFFRETYDRNRDGVFNDGLTHVAIVETVADDGTVTYVHRGGSGVARARLNLLHPLEHASSGTTLNDYLRPRSRLSEAVLGSELFAGAAHARWLAQ
jgi:hypothetical protein